MPGYLSHLAARVFGAKPAIRPRLPSLFESAPGTPAAVRPESSTLRVVEEEHIAPQPAAPHPVATSPRASFQPAARAASAAAHEPEPHSEKPAAQATEAEPQKIPAPAARQPLQSVEAVDDAPQSRPPQRIMVRPELRSVEAPEPSTPAQPRSHPSTPRSDPEPQRPPRAEPAQPHSPRNLQPDQPLAERMRPVAAHAPIAPLPASSLTPLIAPQPEVRPAQRIPAFADSAAQESPAVQVTIGRLIVEAITPAPAPTPVSTSHPRAPRLSLDDYLRQRRSQA